MIAGADAGQQRRERQQAREEHTALSRAESKRGVAGLRDGFRVVKGCGCLIELWDNL